MSREKFARIAYSMDFLYYIFTMSILTVFLERMPNDITDYQDINGCPIIITEEEANNATLFDVLREVMYSVLLLMKIKYSFRSHLYCQIFI